MIVTSLRRKRRERAEEDVRDANLTRNIWCGNLTPIVLLFQLLHLKLELRQTSKKLREIISAGISVIPPPS